MQSVNDKIILFALLLLVLNNSIFFIISLKKTGDGSLFFFKIGAQNGLF